MTTDPTVLILIGPAGSGKGTIAAYLRDHHNIPVIRYSTILRDILDILGVAQARKEISDLSLMLRERFGQDVIAQAISLRLDKEAAPIVVLDGARRKPDIDALSTNRKEVIVYIEASAEDRFDRITARTENTDDATKTLDSFKQDESHDTEVTIPPLKAMAGTIITNDGTLEQLYTKVEELLSTL